MTQRKALAGASAPCNHYEVQASLDSATGILYRMSANTQAKRHGGRHGIFYGLAQNSVPHLPTFHWLEPVTRPHCTAREAGNWGARTDAPLAGLCRNGGDREDAANPL